MTRKEEIINAAYNEAEVERQLKMHPQVFEQGFVAGAKWADRTMIDKACEWLKANLCEHYADEPIAHKMGRPISGYISFFEEPPVGVIMDFRKAMEGEQQ